ncbi:GGDEF domain-containing protein [Vibrio ostreicida]|uniref:GGDEF domain-containing protein n=1 Tax=Vibrio ostreicida TaxID=526588 RepID=UPI003B59E1CA
MTLEEAEVLAERIRRAIKQTRFSFFGKTARITLSMGVSQINRTDDQYAEVFHRADAALYEAKSKGRNRVACSY